MKLLIVDDESNSVRVVEMMLRSMEFRFDSVESAYNIQDAQKICMESAVDILLCDIEMPGGSGLELLRWVRDTQLRTECIFMTCHADFQYAREAIALGCQAYLLKPIDPDELQHEIEKAEQKIKLRRELETARRVRELDQKNRIQRFWVNLMHGEISSQMGQIEQWLTKNDMTLDLERRYCPVVSRVTDWKEFTNRKDQQLFHFAMQNVLEELSELYGLNSWVIPVDINGFFMIVPYAGENSRVSIKECCEEYLKRISQYYSIFQDCYYGSFVPITEISDELDLLFLAEQNFILQYGCFDVHEIMQKMLQPDMKNYLFHEHIKSWKSMLDKARFFEVKQEVKRFLHIYRSGMNKGMLEEFRYIYLGLLWSYAEKNQFALTSLFDSGEVAGKFIASGKDAESMYVFVEYTLDSLEQMAQIQAGNVDPVAKTRAYLESNYSEELNIERIAEIVHLHPDYLGRIFKKETGMGIGKYLIQIRMQEARRLLEVTNLPISQIAARVGYDNYTSFTRCFTREAGIPPQEYKKQIRHK